MNRLTLILCFAAAMLCSCKADLCVPMSPESGICVVLGGVSVSVDDVKATPSQLDRPLADQFTLEVMRNSDSYIIYNGPYTDQKIKALPGSYTVTARAGEENVMAMDSPYYCGRAGVTVVEGADEPARAEITCKVGNALLSVNFGSNDVQKARFDKYYSEACVNMHVGAYSMGIKSSAAHRSIYVMPQTDFVLEFTGCLRADDNKTVSCLLSSESIPSSLEAGQHLILTLNADLAPSGVIINVERAQIVEAELQQTIPFDWLPMPSLTAQQCVEDGVLMGTRLVTSNAYPGCIWKAVVRNASGVVVRTLEGEGALESSYSDSQEWPYLPSGAYSAVFSYTYDGQEHQIEGKSRNFSVPSAQGIGMSASYYTSYTKYLGGDVAAANSCSGNAVYDVRTSLSLSPAIALNSRYSALISNASASVWADDNKAGATSGKASAMNAKLEGLAAGYHDVNMEGSFDGGSAGGSMRVLVSGIPYEISFREYNTKDLVSAQGWTCNGNVGDMSSQLYTCNSGNSGYIVSPQFFVTEQTDCKVSLLQKFYSTLSTSITAYIDSVPYPNTKASANAKTCPSSNNTGADGGRNTAEVNISITPEKPYVSLANGGERGSGISINYYYLHNFSLIYR